MKTDRSELHDLALQKPDETRQLAAKWDAWATRANVLPYPKTGAGKKAGKSSPSGK
jgi:arylsulfatase